MRYSLLPQDSPWLAHRHDPRGISQLRGNQSPYLWWAVHRSIWRGDHVRTPQNCRFWQRSHKRPVLVTDSSTFREAYNSDCQIWRIRARLLQAPLAPGACRDIRFEYIRILHDHCILRGWTVLGKQDRITYRIIENDGVRDITATDIEFSFCRTTGGLLRHLRWSQGHSYDTQTGRATSWASTLYL